MTKGAYLSHWIRGDFEQVHCEILRKDLIPELEECYALVRRENVRRGVMNGQLEILKLQPW